MELNFNQKYRFKIDNEIQKVLTDEILSFPPITKKKKTSRTKKKVVLDTEPSPPKT